MNSAEAIMISILLISGGAYGILIFLFTVGWSRLPKNILNDSPKTSLSVIVALRNESANVENLINNLLQQEYPEKLLEIILVNDHSADDTATAIRNHTAAHKLVFLEQVNGVSGKKNAIRLGISKAKGNLIVTTDADCRPGKQWLKAIDTSYSREKFKMMTGPVVIEKPSNMLARFQSLEFISLVGSGAGGIGMGLPIMCNGANFCYEKSAFEEVGGFDGNEHIQGGDDIFLLEKFKRKYKGSSIGFIRHHAAIVQTNASSNIREFVIQRIRWVSKSPAYRDPFMVLTAITVFLFNLSLLLSLIWSIRSMLMLYIFLLAFLFKCLIDLPLLWKVCGFFKQKYLLKTYLPFQFIYFIFIGLSGIFGNLLSYRWKGRNSLKT